MTQPEPDADRLPADEETGGEAACALHRVCDACGALEQGPPQAACARCGAARSA